MKLSTLLNSIPYIRIVGDAEAEVTGICTDSRKARGGDLFVKYYSNGTVSLTGTVKQVFEGKVEF